MKKSILAAAVAGVIAAPVTASAGDVTIYGVAHLALSNYDTQHDGGDAWDIASHASRLGFKGTEDLGNGLSAFWQMEFQVDMADRELLHSGDSICSSDSTSNCSSTLGNGDSAMRMRNSFVGLKGSWGKVLMGRHDTPYKSSTGSLDLFGDTVADYNGNGSDHEPAGNSAGLGFQDRRWDNAIMYVTPSWNGFKGAVMTGTPGYDSSGFDGHNNADDLIEMWSAAVTYSNGPFFVAAAYEDESSDFHSEDADSTRDDNDKWRVGLGYTANGFHVGFVYEDQDSQATGSTGDDIDRWQLSGSYTFGNNVVKAMWGQVDLDTGSNDDPNQWAVGLDHNFSKRTKVYVIYTDYDSDGADKDWASLSMGMVHKF